MRNHKGMMFFVLVFSGACSSSSTDANPAPNDARSDSTSDASKDTTPSSDTPSDTASDTRAESAVDSVADSGASDGDASDVPAVTCLPTSGADGLDAYFTLMDPTKCVVAQYDVAAAGLSSLTWGRHGGPLGVDASDATSVKVVRWKAPSSTTGALTKTEEAHHLTSVPSGAFFGGQALDLPFYDWTALSYSTTGTGYPGELLLVTSSGDDAAVRYHVNGFFSETAVATSGGRLFYTGLSPISATTTTTNAGGLYFADTCGSASSDPRLVPKTDATCAAPALYKTWQAGTSSPVTIDRADDVFAILSTFGGNEELRGFHHSATARGSTPIDGTTLLSDKNFTSEMAADGKAVYLQPNDPSTFKALDVQAITYGVDDTGKTITAGATSTFLALKKAGTPVALIVDDASRLWVGVAKPTTSDAGPTSSIFFVLGNK